MPNTSKAQLKATRKYEKENIVKYLFRLNKKHDADLIALMESVDNKNGLIKDLLREEVEKRKRL